MSFPGFIEVTLFALVKSCYVRCACINSFTVLLILNKFVCSLNLSQININAKVKKTRAMKVKRTQTIGNLKFFPMMFYFSRNNAPVSISQLRIVAFIITPLLALKKRLGRTYILKRHQMRKLLSLKRTAVMCFIGLNPSLKRKRAFTHMTICSIVMEI